MNDDFEDEDEDDETIFCPKDDCEIDPEKCYECDYLADEDEYHCRFGEVSLSQIEEERIREQDREKAEYDRWIEK